MRRSQFQPDLPEPNQIVNVDTCLQHQVSLKFRADTWQSVGCDVTRATCPDIRMNGVIIRIGVRPSSATQNDSPGPQNVELVISTPGIT